MIAAERGQVWEHNKDTTRWSVRGIQNDGLVIIANINGGPPIPVNWYAFTSSHHLVFTDDGKTVVPTEREFQVGDVVVLKSGGAPMVIIETQGHEMKVRWHDNMAVMQEAVVTKYIIKLFEPEMMGCGP